MYLDNSYFTLHGERACVHFASSEYEAGLAKSREMLVFLRSAGNTGVTHQRLVTLNPGYILAQATYASGLKQRGPEYTLGLKWPGGIL